MRGLAIATLFLGLCLINDENFTTSKDLKITRRLVFFGALIAIGFGA